MADNDLTLPSQSLREPPMVRLSFYDKSQHEVGKLYWNPDDRRIHFEGNVDESAKIFIDTLEKMYLERYPET